mgnify:CR=1 FL=1
MEFPQFRSWNAYFLWDENFLIGVEIFFLDTHFYYSIILHIFSHRLLELWCKYTFSPGMKNARLYQLFCFFITWQRSVPCKGSTTRYQKQTNNMDMTVRKRVRMVGYNLRHPGILALLSHGMVERKNWKGRQKIAM